MLQLIDEGSFYHEQRAGPPDLAERWSRTAVTTAFEPSPDGGNGGPRHVPYDFMNARLDDLPIDQRCARMTKRRKASPTATRPRPMRSACCIICRLVCRRANPRGSHEGHDCQLRNGVFRGRLHIDAGGIHCDAEPNTPACA